MGIIGVALVTVVAVWGIDRLIRGSAAKPLREREGARRVGGAGNAIAEDLPFLGQQVLRLPEPPPPATLEPEPGKHTLVVSAPEPPDPPHAA